MITKRPTIRDVARDAGVSYQTVSRVLNNHPKVSETTRKVVLQTIKDLGYQRNMAAQMLTTHRSQTIQVIVLDSKFPLELHTITNNAREAGYLTVYSESTLEEFPRMLDLAAARLVDGIVLYAPQLVIDDEDLVELSHGIPLVRRDYVVDSNLTWVGFDQVRASQLLVQHLLDLGHQHIAEITGSMNFINPQLRHQAYTSILEAHDLEPGPCVEGDYSYVERAMWTGYEGVRQIIHSGAKFTALIMGNDYMSIGALHALSEHGLRVPDDVSVVSFDNTPHARYLAPPLTVVEFDFQLQDDLAFQHLRDHIENPDAAHFQHVLMPHLIVRESTAVHR